MTDPSTTGPAELDTVPDTESAAEALAGPKRPRMVTTAVSAASMSRECMKSPDSPATASPVADRLRQMLVTHLAFRQISIQLTLMSRINRPRGASLANPASGAPHHWCVFAHDLGGEVLRALMVASPIKIMSKYACSAAGIQVVDRYWLAERRALAAALKGPMPWALMAATRTFTPRPAVGRRDVLVVSAGTSLTFVQPCLPFFVWTR